MRDVTLRQALRGPAPLLGTFSMIPRVEIVEMLALAGFDVVILDLEHGPYTASDVITVTAAAQGASLYTIARVRDGADAEIGNVLDAGVDGVLVPHVETAQDAARIVRAGRFPPEGNRSLNPYVRGTNYALTDDARDAANERVAILVMVEGTDGLRNLEGISAVDGIDGVFVGPVDLSAALGIPGEPEHPTVIETVDDIFQRLAGRGVASSIFAPTTEAARRWFAAGASLVALSCDSAMILPAFEEARAQVRPLRADLDEDDATRRKLELRA